MPNTQLYPVCSPHQQHMTHMPLKDQSQRPQCQQHTPCMMCSHSSRHDQPSKLHTVWTDHHPSQPVQEHRHHSCSLQLQSNVQLGKPTHRYHMVWRDPDRCHESQLDISYSSTMYQERSSQCYSSHTPYSHRYHRHTRQRRKVCTQSHQLPHSDRPHTKCTQSRHRCPSQPGQPRTSCSSSTPHQSTDRSHIPHTVSLSCCRRHSDQLHTQCTRQHQKKSTVQLHKQRRQQLRHPTRTYRSHTQCSCPDRHGSRTVLQHS